MGSELVVSFLLILGTTWMITDARTLDASKLKIIQINNHDISVRETKTSEVSAKNEKTCTLCEEFTAQAVEYLSQNKTQTEILDSLHQACSSLQSYKKQCLMLVDYYAPFLFVEIDLIDPEKFCKKMNLCDKMTSIPPLNTGEACTICHEAVAEILIKLKDPDSELEIVEFLLKTCSKVENFKQQCKKLVFEYVPLILADAQKFLETQDFCTSIHVCETSEQLSAEQTLKSAMTLYDH